MMRAASTRCRYARPYEFLGDNMTDTGRRSALRGDIFGGTAVQISGPTGPMTVVTTGACAGMVAAMGSLEGALPALVVMFVLAGLMQIVMGLLRIGSLIKFIPYPVLASILITVGIGIFDHNGILHLNKVSRSDALVTIIVLLVTVFSSLLVAVAVGMVIASVLFMKRVPFVDQSGLSVRDDATRQFGASRVTALLSGLQSQPWALIRRIGTISGRVPEDHVFASFRQSVEFLLSDYRASPTRA
jgi:MFS superfamily sulfate permease-like transporter